MGDVVFAQVDGAAVRVFESGDHAQHRGLARARRTEQRDELARPDVERHVVGGLHRAEDLADAA